MKRLILILMLLLPGRVALGADAPTSRPATSQPATSQPSTQASLHATIEGGLYWNLLRTEQFGIGIPKKWDDLPQRPNSLLHVGRRNAKDETGKPLEIGL